MMKLKRQSNVWYCKMTATHTAQNTFVHVMGGSDKNTTTSFCLAVPHSGGFLPGNQITSMFPSLKTDNTYNTHIIIITFNITMSHHHHKRPPDKKNWSFNPVRSPPPSCCQLMDNINKQRPKPPRPPHFFVFYLKNQSCFLPVEPCHVKFSRV